MAVKPPVFIPNVCFKPTRLKHACMLGQRNDFGPMFIWNIFSHDDQDGMMCLPVERDYADEIKDLGDYRLTKGQEAVQRFLQDLINTNVAKGHPWEILSTYIRRRRDYSDNIKLYYGVDGMNLYLHWFTVVGKGVFYCNRRKLFMFCSEFGHVIIQPKMEHHPGSIVAVMYCEELGKEMKFALYECLEQPKYLVTVLQYLFPDQADHLTKFKQVFSNDIVGDHRV